MGRPRVWAPGARHMEVVVDGSVASMRPDSGGWWEAPGEAPAGSVYSFRIDGGPDRPDPRSNSQPHGVHGPSCVVDHRTFEWTDASWPGLGWPPAVLYELHVGTFSPEGTFDGAVARLDHLVDLGVDAVEIMPVAEFSGSRGWGYDGVNLFAPHHAYGGPDGLKRLVDACHARGLGVILDVVYNHLGPEGNYLPEFGPYLTDRHSTFWGNAVNFDGPGRDEVRRFVIDNALMWLADYHCDGLRLDAVHAIVDDSPVHILAELAGEVDKLAEALSRPLRLIAESDLNDPVFVWSRQEGGYGLGAVWADEWHHALHATLTGERAGYYCDFGDLASLAKALQQGWVHDGTFSRFRNRVHGRPPAGVRPGQLVIATQTHDQVGNRALGERSGALMDVDRLKAAAALLLTAPFVPLLFAGEEWAASTPFQYFTAHQDPQLGRAVRRGRRQEFSAFGWDPREVPDPQDPDTFERSRLRWGERSSGVHAELLDWYRQLIALRRELPAPDGPPRVRYDPEAWWLLVERAGARVGINLGSQPAEISVRAGAAMLMASGSDVHLETGLLLLPPGGSAVIA